MKKKGGGRKKAAEVSSVAKAAGSAGTPKKKTTSAKPKNKNSPELSDLEETPFDQRKCPPEDAMPSLVPHIWQNDVRKTRNALPQPPAHVFILPVGISGTLDFTLESAAVAVVCLPPFNNKDCNPLNHTSPHIHTPASIVEAVALAASPANANAVEDDDEEDGVNLTEMFDDLVGNKKSGLDDLSYSSDDEDYDGGMEEEARQIEYSDCNNVVLVDGRPISFQVVPNNHHTME